MPSITDRLFRELPAFFHRQVCSPFTTLYLTVPCSQASGRAGGAGWCDYSPSPSHRTLGAPGCQQAHRGSLGRFVGRLPPVLSRETTKATRFRVAFARFSEWPGPESNWGHKDFQSSALPAELPGPTTANTMPRMPPACQPLPASSRSFSTLSPGLPEDCPSSSGA